MRKQSMKLTPFLRSPALRAMLIIGAFFFVFFAFPDGAAHAVDAEPATLDNPLGTTDIPGLVGRVVRTFTGVSGSFALLMFVYGGVVWLTSGGSPERVQKGKKIFIWATIGLAVIFGGYAILNTIFAAIGAS